jgi:hypothetical protein
VIITYSPEGAEPQHFNVGRLKTSEIQIVERTADRRWAEIQNAMSNGDPTAMRVAAWIVKMRQEPTLRFKAFDPWEDELRVSLDRRECGAYAQQLLDKFGDDPDTLAEAWEELRNSAFDTADADAAIADVTAPKDPAPPAEPEPEDQPGWAEATESSSATA